MPHGKRLQYCVKTIKGPRGYPGITGLTGPPGEDAAALTLEAARGGSSNSFEASFTREVGNIVLVSGNFEVGSIASIEGEDQATLSLSVQGGTEPFELTYIFRNAIVLNSDNPNRVGFTVVREMNTSNLEIIGSFFGDSALFSNITISVTTLLSI